MALKSTTDNILRTFDKLGVSKAELKGRPFGIATAEQAYRILRNMADQAANEGNLLRAAEIRQALFASDEFTIGKLQALCKKHLIAEAPTTQAMLRPSATAGPTVTVAAIPPPGATITQCRLDHRLQAVARPGQWLQGHCLASRPFGLLRGR